MSDRANYFQLVLEYLVSRHGDGIYHPIEQLFVYKREIMKDILIEMNEKGLINLINSESLPFFTIETRQTFPNIKLFDKIPSPIKRFLLLEHPTLVSNIEGTSISDYQSLYKPYLAKITFDGVTYYNKTYAMKENRKNIVKIGNRAIANVIIDSKNISIGNQTIEVLDKMTKILKEDNTISIQQRDNATSIINKAKTEAISGEVKKETWKELIELGSNIASVGSLVLQLMQ